MVGTRQLARVTAKMQEIGAKLVLVGDPEQLQPIEAGTPFRDLVTRHGASQLTEVRRQKSDWQREATKNFAAGEIAKGIARYDEQGAVSKHQTQDDAIEALAERYAIDILSDADIGSRIALAHKRLDVHKLNQAIRTALRPEYTSAEDVLLQTDTGKHAFGPGDRIVFTRNDRDLGVKNGMLGTVRKVAANKLIIELDGEGDHHVTFDPHTYASFDHGYAVTIHKSQGVTVDQAYVLGSRSMDQHLAYVAMTRHREGVKLFQSKVDQPKWSQSQKFACTPSRSRVGPSLG